MVPDRDVLPEATTAVSDTDPTSFACSSLTVWLAGPAARAFFTPEKQSSEDLTRWRDIVNTRKREEWEISRALLGHVRGLMGEPERVMGSVTEPTRSLGGHAAVSSDGASAPRVRAPSAAPRAPEGVALSLSHSGGYAAAAASRAVARVGVDLERERPRDIARLARFAFAERESEQLEALATESERDERFYLLWTLKEAFAKALSLPLLASLRQCTFLNASDAWHGSVPTDSAWVAHTFRPSPTLVLSVVALLPERVVPEELHVVTHEWPVPTTTAWRTLASLRSDA